MGDLIQRKAGAPVWITGADDCGDEQSPVNSTVNAELKVVDGIHHEAVYGTLTVGATPVEIKVGATALANRKVLLFQPHKKARWGTSNTISPTVGFKLNQKQYVEIEASDAVSFWVVSQAGTIEVTVMEAR